jgi:hypothetical protein
VSSMGLGVAAAPSHIINLSLLYRRRLCENKSYDYFRTYTTAKHFRFLYMKWFGTGPLYNCYSIAFTILDSHSRIYSKLKNRVSAFNNAGGHRLPLSLIRGVADSMHVYKRGTADAGFLLNDDAQL